MEKLTFDYSEEFETFVLSLPDKDRVKLLNMIQKIEQYGLVIAKKMKWIKKIEDDLYEIRSKVGSNIQRAFYFQIKGNSYYITHAYSKKTQKTSQREIDRAKNTRLKFKGGQTHE